MSADTTSSITPAPQGFPELGVPVAIAAVLAERGIVVPTPIQSATLPDALAGRDVLGRARTGSGKTYAFLLPLVARLANREHTAGKPRALVLVPTRELATQIDTALHPLAAAAGLRSMTVFGGVGQHAQITRLRRGVDVVVACPGRLLDLMGQGHVDLGSVELSVLDEADHMADLGFLPAVRRILAATPTGTQRLLFSATLDAQVSGLVERFLTNPATHQADASSSRISTMAHHVLQVTVDDRLPVLVDLASAPGRSVVFTRTKHGAKKLSKQLNAAGVPAVELHGNLSQNARTRTMERFASGVASTLVATDIAARGIHVDDVGIVIHADPPTEHKAYVHRSGRTARAGADGVVITLATDDQMRDVRELTRKAGVRPVTTRVHPAHPLLRQLAPGDRVLLAPVDAAVPEDPRAHGTRPAKPHHPGSGKAPGSPARRRRVRASTASERLRPSRGRRGGAAEFSASSRLSSRGLR